jgi:hypothetical protein
MKSVQNSDKGWRVKMNSVQKCDFTIGNTRIYILIQSGLPTVEGDAQERLHNHPNPEIHYIEGGGISVYTEDGEHRLEKGTLVLLPPRLYHSFGTSDEGTRRISFEVKLTRIKEGEETFSEYRELLAGICQPIFLRIPMPELSAIY